MLTHATLDFSFPNPLSLTLPIGGHIASNEAFIRTQSKGILRREATHNSAADNYIRTHRIACCNRKHRQYCELAATAGVYTYSALHALPSAPTPMQKPEKWGFNTTEIGPVRYKQEKQGVRIGKCMQGN